MCEYMFDAICGCFVRGNMTLTVTDERGTIPIGFLVLFDVVVKQELVFQFGYETMQGNGWVTGLSGEFAGFTCYIGVYCM